jgi:hypothetical protein
MNDKCATYKRALFDKPTDATCNRNYAEGARCGRLKGHEGACSQVSRWVSVDDHQRWNW